MSDMIFQGTVLGPPLWNIFFQDASIPIRQSSCEVIVYADDLNALRVFPASTSDAAVLGRLRSCQTKLHAWGSANQVSFDPSKESFHILSRLYGERAAVGPNFRALGIDFDCKFSMNDAVTDCVAACSWKLNAILRTHRYYNVADLVRLYKAHVLSFIEYRTPGLSHAAATCLAPLDAIQATFLRKLGISSEEALFHFKLAPLHTRRDIALLGVVHRSAIGRGPPQLRQIFRKLPAIMGPSRRQRPQIEDLAANFTQDYIKRSALGKVNVYNNLPSDVVESSMTVKLFQSAIQDLLMQRCAAGDITWPDCFR